MLSIFSKTPVLATVDDITAIFRSGDPVVQAICVLLLLLSLAVWSIIFDRLFALTRAEKNNRRFLLAFSRTDNIPFSPERTARESGAPAAAVYLTVREHLDAFRPEAPGTGCRNSRNFRIRKLVHEAVNEQSMLLNRRALFLKSAIRGSLFLGMTGLVWGIMIALARFAQADCSDLKLLVSGVPAALLPLAVALFAAIPSFLGSRLIADKTKRVQAQLDRFAERFCEELSAEPSGIGDFLIGLRPPTEGKIGFIMDCCRAIMKKYGKRDEGRS